MTMDLPGTNLPAGAQCLQGLADHVGKRVTPDGTLDAVPRLNAQYVVVHVYLVPGNRTTRLPLRNAILTELRRLNAIPLHDLAYAVPTVHGDERNTAEEVWNALINAGATNEGPRDLWDDGDVLYVHYVGADGMCVLAGAPWAGQRLPQAAEL